jgi:hypothetical protein
LSSGLFDQTCCALGGGGNQLRGALQINLQNLAGIVFTDTQVHSTLPRERRESASRTAP